MKNITSKKIWFKIVALALAISMPVTELYAYAPSPTMPITSPSVAFPLDQITVPSELGTIQEVYQGKGNKLVIHLQDAHGNLSAQESLAGLVKYFHETYGINLVLVEGAEGELPMTGARTFPDAAIREEVAREFMKSWQITGPEYYVISENPDITFVGAETLSGYYTNRDQFMEAFEIGRSAEKPLRQLKTAVRNFQSVIFNKDLREFTRAAERAKTHGKLFPEHLKFLYQAYLKNVNKDLEAFAIQFPQFYKLFSSTEETSNMATYDSYQLLDETKRIRSVIKDKLLQSAEERLLNRLSSIVDLAEGLLTLRLERNGYEDFMAYRPYLTADHVKEQFGVLGKEAEWKDNFSKVFESLHKAIAFYEGAIQRDRTLYATTVKKLHRIRQHAR